MKLDQVIKIVIIAGVILISLSFVYLNIIRPISNEKKLDVCLQEAEKCGGSGGKYDKLLSNCKAGTLYLDANECFKKYPQN